MLILLLACAEPDIDSVAEVTYQPDTSGKEECDTIDIVHDLNAPDPPHVGDTWPLVLWCDDTLLTGTSRILVSPSDAASIVESEVTFLVAGDLELTMQTGTYKATETVTVLE